MLVASARHRHVHGHGHVPRARSRPNVTRRARAAQPRPSRSARGTSRARSVAVTRSRGTIRFTAPGLPLNLRFAVKKKGARLVGVATQGAAKATVTLHKGTRPRHAPRLLRVAQRRGRALHAPRLLDEPVRGRPRDRRVRRCADRAGRASRRAPVRRPLPEAARRRSPERSRSRRAPGRIPASSTSPAPATRCARRRSGSRALFVSRGIAVLAYDKRGIGQSGGTYTGSLASDDTIKTLAGDAAAAARFLAAQKGIDREARRLLRAQPGRLDHPAGGSPRRRRRLVGGDRVRADGDAGRVGQLTRASSPRCRSPRPSGRRTPPAPSGYDPQPWIRKLNDPGALALRAAATARSRPGRACSC